MKKCFKCNKDKILDDFYKHSGMSDGRLNKCIECAKVDSNNQRLHKMQYPEWVEKEAERHRLKGRKAWANGVRPDKGVRARAAKNYHRMYPEKRKAITEANSISIGDGLHRHHWSYLEEHRKDIIAICPTDHAMLHRFIVYDQERMQYRRIDNSELLDSREAHEKYMLEVLSTQIQ